MSSKKNQSVWIEQTQREKFIQRNFAALTMLEDSWDLGSPILSYKHHPQDKTHGFPSYPITQCVLRPRMLVLQTHGYT